MIARPLKRWLLFSKTQIYLGHKGDPLILKVPNPESRALCLNSQGAEEKTSEGPVWLVGGTPKPVWSGKISVGHQSILYSRPMGRRHPGTHGPPGRGTCPASHCPAWLRWQFFVRFSEQLQGPKSCLLTHAQPQAMGSLLSSHWLQVYVCAPSIGDSDDNDQHGCVLIAPDNVLNTLHD